MGLWSMSRRGTEGHWGAPRGTERHWGAPRGDMSLRGDGIVIYVAEGRWVGNDIEIVDCNWQEWNGLRLGIRLRGLKWCKSEILHNRACLNISVTSAAFLSYRVLGNLRRVHQCQWEKCYKAGRQLVLLLSYQIVAHHLAKFAQELMYCNSSVPHLPDSCHLTSFDLISSRHHDWDSDAYFLSFSRFFLISISDFPETDFPLP